MFTGTTILNRKFKGKDVLISRISIYAIYMLFQFKILKFPIKLSITMDISQDQSMNLENQLYLHGQFYIAYYLYYWVAELENKIM